MRQRLARTVAAVACAALATAAAPAAAAEIQHVHLSAPDPEGAVQWYVTHLGCTAWARKDSCRTNTSAHLHFSKGSPKAGSEGSGIDHIGFSFPDLTTKLRQLEADGVKVVGALREVPGFYRIAFIEDPWGTRIELVEDPEYPGFHHVHLRAAAPGATLDWYQRIFGGERLPFRGKLDSLRYGRVWLLASPAPAGAGPIAPTAGRSADHFSFDVGDINRAAAILKAAGIEAAAPRRYVEPYTKQELWFVLITAPDGVRVELLELR